MIGIGEYVKRRDPPTGGVMPTRNVRRRVLEHFPSSNAPDPVRYGDFWNQGKGPFHARSHYESVYTWAAPEYRAVMADDFLAPKVIYPALASQPYGSQASHGGRTNIARSGVRAYGSLIELQAQRSSGVPYSGGQGATYNPW